MKIVICFQALHDSYEDWLIKKKFGDIKAPILVLDANQVS